MRADSPPPRARTEAETRCPPGGMRESSSRKTATHRGSLGRATIRTVSRGLPWNPGSGAWFAIPMPSTPSAAHARLARVGPRSGPPCLCEPPTIVGAIPSASAAQVFAPGQPFSAIRSSNTSPVAGGGTPVGSGQRKWPDNSLRTATNTTRGRNCGTPKSQAFISFQPGSYPSLTSARRT